jgi:pimeloyl-ACP methyl ester carboxylesterase
MFFVMGMDLYRMHDLKMKEIYLVSGLGADERVFEYLDLQPYKRTCLQWIRANEDETLEQYAARLCEQIKVENPVLIGVSFGGMIAVEIGKLIKTEKIILISSVKTKEDIPLHYRVMGAVNFNKLMPMGRMKDLYGIIAWLFGVSSKEERQLLEDILNSTDERFVHWAIDHIINWENKILLPNAVLIHGTSDRLLSGSTPDYSIKDGGHFMIVNRCEEISAIIKGILASVEKNTLV